jgi:anaerobic magnesium-protoporphyrin IX monomethyl ester cyclase
MTRSTVGRQLDVLFINPDSSAKAYQALANVFSAIEPPTWSLLLAESCRAKGFGVAILDCDAERLAVETAAKRVLEANPRLALFVVYGQNPNSGTTSMIGALSLSRRPLWTKIYLGMRGTFALPRKAA